MTQVTQNGVSTFWPKQLISSWLIAQILTYVWFFPFSLVRWWLIEEVLWETGREKIGGAKAPKVETQEVKSKVLPPRVFLTVLLVGGLNGKLWVSCPCRALGVLGDCDCCWTRGVSETRKDSGSLITSLHHPSHLSCSLTGDFGTRLTVFLFLPWFSERPLPSNHTQVQALPALALSSACWYTILTFASQNNSRAPLSTLSLDSFRHFCSLWGYHSHSVFWSLVLTLTSSALHIFFPECLTVTINKQSLSQVNSLSSHSGLPGAPS